jgi:hypothetical protein
LDEPLPGQRSLILEQAQFLLGRIGKARTRQSRVYRQQAGLDDALELDKFGRGSWRSPGTSSCVSITPTL